MAGDSVERPSGASAPSSISRLQLPGSSGFAAGYTRGPLTARALDADTAARALADALDAPEAEVARLRQVHGARVLTFEERARKRANSLLGDGDAALTCQPNVLLLVASADCVPIVLADARTGWMAAVHAGWRGTAARVLDAALDALEAHGVKLRDVSAAFGPSIARDRYEVGPEVVAALGAAYGNVPHGVRPGAAGKAFVDVALFNEAALLARGVPASAISRAGAVDTFTSQDLPSYRREGPGTGRILTGIVRVS